MPKLTRKRTILLKSESSYGTDPSPTGSANAVLVRDLNIEPIQSDEVSRDLIRGYLGNYDTLLANQRVNVTFDVEMSASGTAGTEPHYSPALKACGLAVTTVSSTSNTYAPISSSFGSCTVYVNIDGVNHAVTGCRGTFSIACNVNEIPIISLVGRAGCGKTLCAIAAGMEQCLGNKTYNKLIVSRPVQPLGKDIGFLPGTMHEKMMPWLMPIQDNLKFLMGDRTSLEMYMEKGKIEIEALTYIRGRSISNAFIVIDEAQNLTKHEIKTIITRIGEGTKIILTGDVEQIDIVYVNETSNGLAHAVESFKEYPIAGHMTFKKGERSELATLASKVL